MPISGDWGQTARPLFRACRPGYENTTTWIEFKYHATQKASSRIKRVLLHILSVYVLELIATGIFYEFLNIYKILRTLRKQNIVKFQRPKITSDTWFQTEKTFHVKKQSLSFQTILSKLWATYEMNFWERKVHGAFKCNLTFLTWQIRGSAPHKSIPQQMFQPKSSPTVIHRCFICIRWNVSYHFVSCEWRNLILAFRCIIWTRLANINIWVKFRLRNSEVFKIYTKYVYPF